MTLPATTGPGLTTRRAALVGIGAGVLAGCAPSSRAITVFAAASLTDAFESLAEAWRLQTGTQVRLSFGASGSVARQIEAGAPADIVALADTVWMDRLQAAGRLKAGSRLDLVANALVVIAEATAQVSRDPLDDLLKGSGRLAIGDPDSVPAGAYARTWLTSIGLWQTLQPRLVLASDVRAVRNFVIRGEAALGIVYRSDTVGAPQTRIVAEPAPPDRPTILYPMALTAEAVAEAAAFAAFLQGPGAAATFRRFGFEPSA